MMRSTIYDNPIWIQDIDLILEHFPEIEDLAGQSVLITGAGGLICSALVDVLIRYNETHCENIVIHAAARSGEKLKKRFGEYFNRDYFFFEQYDANSSEFPMKYQIDYIIHGAGNASPNKIIKEPVETMLSNFAGLYTLLRFSKGANTKRLLYISSSEVYGQKNDDQPYLENDYGYIDLLNTRNSYSIGKRSAETLCSAFSEEYGTETVIVRPGHIYGPTASITDNRVSSAWTIAAAKGEDIVMKSAGTQLRSYVYCLDCASAIVKVLLRGENVHAYNISNPSSVISIREMAEIVAQAGDVNLRLEIPTEEERKGFNPMQTSALRSDSLLALGWRGLFDARTGFMHTVQIIKAKS